MTVPGLLRDAAGGECSFTLEAATVAAAIERLRSDYPLLKVHIFDEQGQIRPHVLIFYNDESVGRMTDLEVPLRPGDCLHVVQAVSGGSS